MEFEVPLIVSGDIKNPSEFCLDYESDEEDLSLFLPRADKDDLNFIKSNAQDVHELSLDEIISFYSRVGDLWKDRNYPLRQDAVSLASRITGFHERMLDHAYDFCAEMLSREYLRDLADAEIMDRRFLDEWIPVKDVFVHAQPRGRVLHVLSGNAPPIAVISMIRGSLTKNSNILKIPKGDPITAIYFALSFRDVDEDHPITRSTSVIYWNRFSDIVDDLISLSDAVCAWGGKQSVESVKQKVGYGTHFLEFGPRRSMQLFDITATDDLREVTDKAAHDIVLFDQEACHSPQIAFVRGDVEAFCGSLADSLKEEGDRLPKGFVSSEEHAMVSHIRSMSKFMGDDVFVAEDTEWTIIVTDKMERISSHPLSRTLYVFEVDDLRECLDYVDESVQTAAVFPEDMIKELRDELTLKGVDRVTHLGRMGYPAIGAPHEGVYPLSQLVRWVKSK